MSAADQHYRGSSTNWVFLWLRLAGLIVIATAGWEKIHALMVALQSGKPLEAAGLAPLIKKLGLPFPGLCALYVALNESLSAALITVGFLTRISAFCAALSMSAAFLVAQHLGWEPLRAFTFLFVFATLAACGVGEYSADARFIKWQWVPASSDMGLLILRIGIALYFVLLFTLKVNRLAGFAKGPSAFFVGLGTVLAVCAVLGCFTREASIASCLLWSWGAVTGIVAGQKWDIFPYRDALLVFVFVALAIAGPGRYRVFKSRA